MEPRGSLCVSLQFQGQLGVFAAIIQSYKRGKSPSLCRARFVGKNHQLRCVLGRSRGRNNYIVWNVAATSQRCFTSCHLQCLTSVSHHIQTRQELRQKATNCELHRAVLYCCTSLATNANCQHWASTPRAGFWGP